MADSRKRGAKCEAKANGNPSAAANWAPKVDEPRIYSGTSVPFAGNAFTRVSAIHLAGSACSSRTSWGKVRGGEGSRRSARMAAWSRAGGPAEAEIDAVGMDGGERAELLGDGQG